MNIIFLEPKSGRQLTMPVTPPEWEAELGREVEQVDMAQTGQVNLPGLESLFDERREFLLPSGERNYTVPGYAGDPFAVVDTLVGWSREGTVLRLIASGTPLNVPVLLGPVRYGQRDGTGDVYATLVMRQYRELAAETVEDTSSQNGARAAPEDTSPAQESHTVVKGDTLWAICKKQYGDGSLAWKLAEFNGIKNANLIFPGQVVQLPDKGALT